MKNSALTFIVASLLMSNIVLSMDDDETESGDFLVQRLEHQHPDADEEDSYLFVKKESIKREKPSFENEEQSEYEN